MKKILLLIISLLLITGCSVEYNIEIGEDLKVTEEVKMTGTSDFFSNYYKTTKKNVLLSFLEDYKDILKEKGYEYELIEGQTPYVLAKKTYNNINEYINDSIMFNDYFDEIKYTENNNKIKIETIGFNENNPDNPDRFNVNELLIKIKSFYKVENHNAYDIDKKTNTYYYQLNDDCNYKVMIELNTNSKFRWIDKMYIIIIVGALIMIASWIFVIVMKKKENNNY